MVSQPWFTGNVLLWVSMDFIDLPYCRIMGTKLFGFHHSLLMQAHISTSKSMVKEEGKKNNRIHSIFMIKNYIRWDSNSIENE